jgi:hypothetical protein
VEQKKRVPRKRSTKKTLPPWFEISGPEASEFISGSIKNVLKILSVAQFQFDQDIDAYKIHSTMKNRRVVIDGLNALRLAHATGMILDPIREKINEPRLFTWFDCITGAIASMDDVSNNYPGTHFKSTLDNVIDSFMKEYLAMRNNGQFDYNIYTHTGEPSPHAQEVA